MTWHFSYAEFRWGNESRSCEGPTSSYNQTGNVTQCVIVSSDNITSCIVLLWKFQSK